MIKPIFEAYFLLAYLLLHLTLLSCDQSCIVPLWVLKDHLPKQLGVLAIRTMQTIRLTVHDAQIIGQVMFLGDMLIMLIFFVKIIRYFFKKLLAIFACLAISVIILTIIEVI